MFIYLFWERERERRENASQESGTEKGRENPKQAPCSAWVSRCGAQFHNNEIMTWAEVKSRRLNWQSYPGAPVFSNKNSNVVSFLGPTIFDSVTSLCIVGNIVGHHILSEYFSRFLDEK